MKVKVVKQIRANSTRHVLKTLIARASSVHVIADKTSTLPTAVLVYTSMAGGVSSGIALT